ncbi:MAG: IS1595 family transposase [Proteobacteria bacterium]|nr:IS1595 family transposase [Pseudomonadota bacterium]
MMIYFCCDELRRNAVKAHATLNGIDFLEVLDDPDLPDDQRQRMLFVHFVKPLSMGALTKDNVRINGGERIRNIVVASVSIGTGDDDHILTVQVEQPGDFSTYRLSLVQSVTVPNPPTGFDPRLSQVDFSFKVECPSDFDCKPQRICPPQALIQPEIDYLTKDYATFRQLMLDRISLLSPKWTQRNTADLGVTLVELLAFVGDYLSYQQDAIATEAYLGTARRRVSVRRHARLVDYFMHDGSNARTWVQLEVDADVAKVSSGDPAAVPKGTALSTGIVDQPIILPDDDAARKWFEGKIWASGPYCPHCGSINVQTPITHKSMTHRCRDCEGRPQFSLKTGNIMEGSKLGYQTWAIAIYLVTTSLKGVSSMKLHRDLEITQKTAWHLAHRIRKTWSGSGALFAGPVEVDETYIGGKVKGKGRAYKGNKTPVVALVERKREMVLLAHLRNHVHLVDFEPGRVEFRPTEAAPTTLANELGEKLGTWTGERWVAVVSGEEGAPTIDEQERAARAREVAEASRHPLVAAVLETFDDAEIIDVRRRGPSPDPGKGDS